MCRLDDSWGEEYSSRYMFATIASGRLTFSFYGIERFGPTI